MPTNEFISEYSDRIVSQVVAFLRGKVVIN
ncbi:enhancer of zeste, ezh [Culex quinquefasciatus]|uniref:Enhancer of zeste, ezh n=1 Tax=Culex quinquefasciatus TaxID=7176 RepID=B0WGI6_CULQU|nr:enhancer of zeste, ezh [Culex quinquefasciatus]|eukprot:XP_001847820.1 enhancer of zeste, ezh [Culex quinquefasciatus]